MTIARYIEKDLERRIRGGQAQPEQLTLIGLAKHYGVSMTPVRRAVDELTDRGLLCKGPQGRLSVNARRLGKLSRQNGHSAMSPPNWKNWDAILAREVLVASLRGHAIYLREESVAERLGVGRTVLRHAFGRLAGAGLLHYVPRRGWQVRPFREEDLASYLKVRESLELLALELARPRLSTEALQRMLEGNQPCLGEQAPSMDNQLHQYFIQLSENRYIQDFFERQGGYFTALFDYAALGADVVAEMARQHREILEHVLARRWAKAREALAGHIHAQHAVMLRMLQELEPEAMLKPVSRDLPSVSPSSVATNAAWPAPSGGVET